MVDKGLIESLVKEQLAEGMFLVAVTVSTANAIHVSVDSVDGITIDRCVEISRYLEQNLDREREDFELEVSSPGLSEPFRVWEQYLKNRGRQVEIVTTGGEKFTGLLKAVTRENLVIETSVKEKVEGKKRKELVIRERPMTYDDIVSAKVVVLFK